ncbi:hypothetical protein B9T34_04625 [Acinetobacter sp. ANC 3813]|nr:hypothetical protein B9T34_04625 [Acinetobacter sp. ANC 3813]
MRTVNCNILLRLHTKTHRLHLINQKNILVLEKAGASGKYLEIYQAKENLNTKLKTLKLLQKKLQINCLNK